MKKLSDLQRFILLEARRRGKIYNYDILIGYFGFKSTGTGNLKFKPAQIGVKKYRSASVSVARALTRLRNRGLMFRSWQGHALTPAGREAVNFCTL